MKTIDQNSGQNINVRTSQYCGFRPGVLPFSFFFFFYADIKIFYNNIIYRPCYFRNL